MRRVRYSVFMSNRDGSHDKIILDQFTRQAETFGVVQSHSDKEAMAELVRLLVLSTRDEVLDVACGPGIVACELAPHAKRVVGVDFVPAMLDKARTRAAGLGIANAEWRRGDGGQLDFPDACFSRVVTRYSFHHMLRPAETLAEMTRVCGVGGLVVVIDATPEAGKQQAYNDWERLRDPSHATAMTRAELLATAEGLPLRLEAEHFYRLDCSLAGVLGSSFPVERAGAVYARQLSDDVGRDTLSVAAYRRDGALWFGFPITIAVWRKV